MGYRRLDTLTACANKGFWVLLRCRCGHEARENPMVLVQRITRRNVSSSTRLDRLSESLVCGRCGRKDFTAEHCESPAIWSG